MDVIDILQLNIGEAISIAVKAGRVYKSTLQDAAGRYLMLSAPTYKGIPVIFRKGDIVALTYFRDTGRTAVDARVVGFKLDGNVRCVIFEPYGVPRKEQLRDSFRLEGLRLRCAVLREDTSQQSAPLAGISWLPGSIVDISESGLCISSRIKYLQGENVTVRAWLQWPAGSSPPFGLRAEIRRSEAVETGAGGFITGARFLDRDEATRRNISKFVLMRQQEMLRQSRQPGSTQQFRPGDRKRER